MTLDLYINEANDYARDIRVSRANGSRAYTLQGTLAQAGHKGIIIKNGKKYIR